MNSTLLIGGVLAVGGVISLLVMESKLIGMVASGLAAVFIALSFYGDMAANRDASTATQSADQAEFDRDFAATNCEITNRCDKAQLEKLSKRADLARAGADAAAGKRDKTLADSEKTRKPLMDALTREANAASKEPEKKDSKGGMVNSN